MRFFKFALTIARLFMGLSGEALETPMHPMKIALVTPVYDDWESFGHLLRDIETALRPIDADQPGFLAPPDGERHIVQHQARAIG